MKAIFRKVTKRLSVGTSQEGLEKGPPSPSTPVTSATQRNGNVPTVSSQKLPSEHQRDSKVERNGSEFHKQDAPIELALGTTCIAPMDEERVSAAMRRLQAQSHLSARVLAGGLQLQEHQGQPELPQQQQQPEPQQQQTAVPAAAVAAAAHSQDGSLPAAIHPSALYSSSSSLSCAECKTYMIDDEAEEGQAPCTSEHTGFRSLITHMLQDEQPQLGTAQQCQQQQSRHHQQQHHPHMGTTAEPMGLKKASNPDLLPNMDIDFGSEIVVFNDSVLGKGASSTVYRGLYKNRPVAIKMIPEELIREERGAAASPSGASAGAGADAPSSSGRVDDLALFQQEVQVLSLLRHPNIVKLYGCCLRPPSVFLVEDLCTTTLSKVLHENPQPVPLKSLLRIALGIARGLEYLHSMKPPIIHRDLKPDNILLDTNGQPRISDFGLARCKYASSLKTARREAGTLIYMAPECFDPSIGKLTERMDIFSLGVILWEVITRRVPWEGLQMYDFLQRVIIDGARLPLPTNDDACPFALRRLISRCWDTDPRERPACGEVVAELERMCRFLPDPM